MKRLRKIDREAINMIKKGAGKNANKNKTQSLKQTTLQFPAGPGGPSSTPSCPKSPPLDLTCPPSPTESLSTLAALFPTKLSTSITSIDKPPPIDQMLMEMREMNTQFTSEMRE